jgi:phosphoglycerate dehydrogenase-like enzyme
MNGAAIMSGTGDTRRREKFRVHIKNNRTGEPVFRVTPQRYRQACRRHKELAERVEVQIDWDLDNFEASIGTAQALVTWDLPTQDLARRAPNLKWIHVIGAGIEHLQPLDWLPDDVSLINNKGVHAPKAQEYATTALLMLHTRMPALFTRQRQHHYDALFTRTIEGRRLLVIGAGNIGTAIARAGKELGLQVTGIRRSGLPCAVYDEMYGPERLDEALPSADFVALSTPLTAATRNLMDDRRLRLLRPGAALLNMSRAQVLDQRALADTLRAGRLSGAMIDVVDPEPLPKDSPLWDVPNLVITPHISSDDEEAYIPRTLDLLFENIERELEGRPLRNVVDRIAGY